MNSIRNGLGLRETRRSRGTQADRGICISMRFSPKFITRSREIGVGFNALYSDLPARQSERLRTLGYVGFLGGLIGGIGYCAQQVEAPDPLLSALVIERGVRDTYIALAWSLCSQVYDFVLGVLAYDGEGTTPFVVAMVVVVVGRGGAYGSQETYYAKRHPHHCHGHQEDPQSCAQHHFLLIPLPKEGRDYCRLTPPRCTLGSSLMDYKEWRNFGEFHFHALR